jgi:GNAT superfamily N-acetyltransferase
LSYRLELDGVPVGFGSVAVAGPWKDKPTVFEFYVLPEHRLRAFDLFEVFLGASGARFFEVQTSDVLLTVMLHTYGREIASEKIVFADRLTTTLPQNGAVLRRITPEAEIRDSIVQRQGGGEWCLELDGNAVAKGGVLFHYNQPYGDIYMEVAEPFRRRGLGSYFLQELKRECYGLGAVPCARCNPDNVASRQTLQRAGFVPFAHILNGTVVGAKTGHRASHPKNCYDPNTLVEPLFQT